MRGSAVSLVTLALVLVACAASTAPGNAPVPASPSVGASPSAAPPTFCAGRTWPPYRLGGIPGITATSRDRATIEITNGTTRTYYYRVSGWHPEQFETCRAFDEREVERGPIAPGATVQAMIWAFGDRLDVPVTVAFWDEPCGEACHREPIAAMQVLRSAIEPGST